MVVLVQPLLTQTALQNSRALMGSTALIATFIGLVVTVLVTDGLEIDGADTWLFATVIVWGATLHRGVASASNLHQEAGRGAPQLRDINVGA